jgi:orotate phosphoribosyltransferase
LWYLKYHSLSSDASNVANSFASAFLVVYFHTILPVVWIIVSLQVKTNTRSSKKILISLSMSDISSIPYYLLQSKAIKLEPANPFTWASGWKSPIYCDNRRTLGFPEIRNIIKDALVAAIRKYYPQAEVIAGVATGAIAQGALVADAMNLPFVYVRSSAKEHGLGNRIEGNLESGQKTVVVEDLISTGGSSISAVEALRDAGNPVLGMVAIFSYGFPVAETNFRNAGCELHTLTNYTELLELALDSGYIHADQMELLKKWREAPEKWG